MSHRGLYVEERTDSQGSRRRGIYRTRDLRTVAGGFPGTVSGPRAVGFPKLLFSRFGSANWTRFCTCRAVLVMKWCILTRG